MARRGSGLRTAIKVVKAIDRANKQAARNTERRRKQAEREEARRIREHDKNLREMEREEKASEKARIAAEKKRFKDDLAKAQLAYEARCNAREDLRNKYIDEALR